jgi:2-oxoglutarate dehydrogenase E1 component
VDRLLFCSGKIGIDLLDRLETAGAGKNVAIIRIEQLSPFPMAEIQETIQSYSKGVEVFWVQEEPQNMGPWPYIQSRMLECLPEDQQPAYFGRPASSSPAEGSSTRHQATQSHILDEALGLTRLSMPDQEKIR